jgi:hypothetical protein
VKSTLTDLFAFGPFAILIGTQTEPVTFVVGCTAMALYIVYGDD